MSELIIEPIEKYGLSKKDRPKQLFSKVGIVGCGTVGQNHSPDDQSERTRSNFYRAVGGKGYPCYAQD